MPALTKRGDTLIEVMIAMAILAVITIVTVTMMNSGLNVAERSLELTTARNELNAQAEALRFIHSSYVSELNLPLCSDLNASSKEVRCQAFAELWTKITELALHYNDTRAIQLPTTNCQRDIYDNGKKALSDDHAFVINTRLLQASNSISTGVSLDSLVVMTSNGISGLTSKPDVFQMPDLNARILYNNPDTSLTELSHYTNLIAAQGIWVVGVDSQETGSNGKPLYYDFHIETCWNNAGNNAASSLDAVIRLYNPAARG